MQSAKIPFPVIQMLLQNLPEREKKSSKKHHQSIIVQIRPTQLNIRPLLVQYERFTEVYKTGLTSAPEGRLRYLKFRKRNCGEIIFDD